MNWICCFLITTSAACWAQSDHLSLVVFRTEKLDSTLPQLSHNPLPRIDLPPSFYRWMVISDTTTTTPNPQVAHLVPIDKLPRPKYEHPGKKREKRPGSYTQQSILYWHQTGSHGTLGGPAWLASIGTYTGNVDFDVETGFMLAFSQKPVLAVNSWDSLEYVKKLYGFPLAAGSSWRVAKWKKHSIHLRMQIGVQFLTNDWVSLMDAILESAVCGGDEECEDEWEDDADDEEYPTFDMWSPKATVGLEWRMYNRQDRWVKGIQFSVGPTMFSTGRGMTVSGMTVSIGFLWGQ